MLEDFTLTAVLIIFGIVASGIAGLIGGVYRKKTDQFKKLSSDVELVRKRCWRIEKTIIILTKMQEDTIETTHPELRTEWEELVRELLKATNDD